MSYTYRSREESTKRSKEVHYKNSNQWRRHLSRWLMSSQKVGLCRRQLLPTLTKIVWPGNQCRRCVVAIDTAGTMTFFMVFWKPMSTTRHRYRLRQIVFLFIFIPLCRKPKWRSFLKDIPTACCRHSTWQTEWNSYTDDLSGKFFYFVSTKSKNGVIM